MLPFSLVPKLARRLNVQRRRLLTAAVRCGHDLQVYVLTGSAADPPKKECLLTLNHAVTGGSIHTELTGSDLVLTYIPDEGGLMDIIPFKKELLVDPYTPAMRLCLDAFQNSAWISRTGIAELQLFSHGSMVPLLEPRPMVKMISGETFVYHGNIPQAILAKFTDASDPDFPYDFKEILGEGGQAVVHRCVSYVDGHEAAVRKIHISPKKSVKFVYFKSNPWATLASKGFLARTSTSGYNSFDVTKEPMEVKILKELCHENIKGMTVGFASDSYLCIGQEYCSMSVEQAITNGISNEQKDKISTSLFKGMTYLFQKDIIHGDIKTDNVFADDGMNVKIGDFGSASVVERGEYASGSRPPFTVIYAAPELMKFGNYNHKVDVWAGGMFCFNVHLPCGTRDYRLQAIVMLKKLISLPEWDKDPQSIWMSSPLSKVWGGNPQVLFETLRHDPEKRSPPSRIVELLEQWAAKRTKP